MLKAASRKLFPKIMRQIFNELPTTFMISPTFPTLYKSNFESQNHSQKDNLKVKQNVQRYCTGLLKIGRNPDDFSHLFIYFYLNN